jgi:hypothetical protein
LTTCFFSRGAETVRFGNFELSGSGAFKRLGRQFFSLLHLRVIAFCGTIMMWTNNYSGIVNGRETGVTEAGEVLD